MCGFLLHCCHVVGDVFNMKRSPYGFNFYLICVENFLVDNRTYFNQKIIHILYLPVMTSIL
jgi:hypothetical protein